MKKSNEFLFLFLTLVVILIVAGVLVQTSQAKGKFLFATGQEVNLAVTDPGSIECIGGAPTGDPYAPCTPGTRRIHTRGRESINTYTDVTGTAAPMFQGENSTIGNCNFNADLQGHCWGTFEWEIPALGGVWQGTWSGDFDLLAFTASYKAVGHGSGGDLEGSQFLLETIYPGGTYFGTFTVRVINRK